MLGGEEKSRLETGQVSRRPSDPVLEREAKHGSLDSGCNERRLPSDAIRLDPAGLVRLDGPV
jgi:hypothetical protein